MKTLVLLGATTGQRLSDLLALKWQDLDLTKRLIEFHPAKTRRVVVMPMTKEAVAHLKRLPKADADALVLPGLGSRGSMAVSRQFTKLAKQVGIAGARFHSLRMTFVHQLQTVSSTPSEVMAVLAHVKGAAKSKGQFSLATVIEKLPLLK